MKKIVSWLAGLALTGAVLVAGIGLFWFFGSTNYLLTGVPVLNYHQVNDKFQTVLTMTPADFERLERWYPGRFQIEYDRDQADYVYESEKLITLAGKKLHGKQWKTMSISWAFLHLQQDTKPLYRK